MPLLNLGRRLGSCRCLSEPTSLQFALDSQKNATHLEKNLTKTYNILDGAADTFEEDSPVIFECSHSGNPGL